MRQLLKNKKIKFGVALTIVIIAMVSLALYVADIKNTFYTVGVQQKETGSIEFSDSNIELKQRFTAVADGLERIVIQFDPLDEESGGTVLIGLRDENGNIIKENEITRNYIRGNTGFMFKFPKQKESKNKEYELYFKFYDLGQYKQFISLKVTNQNEHADKVLLKNDVVSNDETLVFTDMYESNVRKKIFAVIMCLMIVCITTVAWLIFLRPNMKIENMFLLIALVTYVFFFVAMPTFKNHDEYYHWLRAYEISQGNLVTPIENKVQGSKMPDGISEIATSNWIDIRYSTMKETSSIRLNRENPGVLNSETAAVYSCVQYFPQSAGIFVGRLFTDRALYLTYFGRFFNMIISIVILYIAIKITPFGKRILLVAAMLPIAIEGFTSLSPDALTISISFLFIAYILKISFSNDIEKITTKHKVIILAMSVVIALCKIVYIPLVGLTLLIPKEKFNNKRKMITIIVIGIIAVAVNLCWLYFSSRYLATFREGDSKIQVMLALKNPIQYVQNMMHTVNINSNSYLMSLYGSELGWGELVKVHYIVPFTMILLHIVAVITDDDIKGKFKKSQLFWLGSIFLTIVVLIFTSLYVQWTMIGKESIAGVQGRYFLPILPLFLIGIASAVKVKSLYNEKNVDKLVGITAMCVQLFVVSQILIANL